MSAAAPPLEPGSPTTALRGVGPARARQLAEAGFHRVRDLLLHLPARYEDRSTVTPVAELAAAGPHTFVGRLSKLTRVRLRGRRATLVRGELDDGSGTLPVAWFNRPYLLGQVVEETDYLLHGAVRRYGESWQLLNPVCETPRRALAAGGVVPVYPALGGTSPTFFRSLLRQILETPGLLEGLSDDLPARLRARHGLPPLAEALTRVHRPRPDDDLVLLDRRATTWHARLIYGELLALQVRLALSRERQIRALKPHAYVDPARLEEPLAACLPFTLTAAQAKVTDEILRDLGGRHPMLRLLQGDVGSGKTAVAALAALLAVESGLQAAFMAPTELLAEQHARALAELLGDRCRVALVTSSRRDLAAARRALAEGHAQIAVGTHALIQESVRFERLGLVVIDEQHRFGVVQRRLLEGKGARPDVLVMTATPIPRSLALTLYGDLAVSVLDELPPGRRPVATRLRPVARRKEVYAELEEALAGGERAYVVLPLIEDSERVAAASIERWGERLGRRFAPYGARLLHGRVPADERDAVMAEFRRGEARLLIATTVIEVGVDVPEATLMVIENAERFGLAQLHQLRGRIGRGPRASRCVALHGELTDDARRRLEVFAAIADGFEIAEADLDIRGPGDLLGVRQAGLPRFRVADLARDRRWLERARDDAREIVAAPGDAEHRRYLERRAGGRAAQRGGGG